jgi:hypothetical protein
VQTYKPHLDSSSLFYDILDLELALLEKEMIGRMRRSMDLVDKLRGLVPL